ncbi:MAG: DUF1028 domain-containing protein [Candidatus Binatus sp.]|uniref:DUF1028 domain-containing protein n=1 Tax=Candidatus Binatus sp. TaxID=2811406 RepID=UPI00272059D4|nr:DUF1028 domain-containing protein [Candidatus Binatus sp.]MDO8433931.1 DUF1028 domain-containing protein [Candidatus Binatus sp.]
MSSKDDRVMYRDAIHASAALAHTYSIVARDPDNGQLGVAVQSHYFSVGSVVTWAEAGVGAVASQALSEPAYGKLGLDLMRAGKSAQDTLNGLLASDPMKEIRQVAMIDARGNAAAHTGSITIPEAGHVVGDGFSVQANMMLKSSVWPAMAEAYRGANGPLIDRLLASLDAAESEGGDIRGRQSAAVLIVDGANTGRSWDDTIFDLRVDDAVEPLIEIRRLADVRKAYLHHRLADAAMADGDVAAMDREYENAERLIGDNPEMRYWHAVALLSLGQIEPGLAMLKEIGARDRNWIELTLRLPAMMLRRDPAVLQRIKNLLT